MLPMIGLGVCVYVWAAYAQSFTLFLAAHASRDQAQTLYQFGPAIFAVLLIVLLLLLKGLASAWVGRHRSDGVWNSTFGRRVIGIAARSTLFGGITLAAGYPVYARTDNIVAAGIAGLTIAIVFNRRAKIALGRKTQPLRWLLAGRHAGMGGSAAFSGLLDEWANPWEPGKVLLGASKYDPKWLVGISDDRHLCTIATSRAGKGRSFVIPALLTWPGSALIIDPKGQNAAVTARKRGQGGAGIADPLGQTVRIVDPLGEINDPDLRTMVARFNPLANLNPSAPDYVETVRAIADALVVPSGDKSGAFFDNAARGLIAGVIDYTMMSRNVGNDERNLATVRGLIVHPDGPPLDEMAEMGGLAGSGAAGMKSGGENSTADVLFTAMTATDWLDSPGMQNALSASDFRLEDLNDGNTTVFLVLPPTELETHSRFLRLFVNLSLKAAAKRRKSGHSTLYLLDEFYSLGPLALLAKASGLLAGFGVKLWPIIQNIGQVQELYPQNWETFLGNAGIWTVFSMNDKTTAQYLSDRVGTRINWRKMKGPGGYEWEIAGRASLRDPLELSKETSRRSRTVCVFTESGEAFLLSRVNYDTLFAGDQFSEDPHEKGGR
jgi:hypothetical protein